MEPLEAGASQAAKDADVCERLAQRLRRTWPPAHWGPRPEDTTPRSVFRPPRPGKVPTMLRKLMWSGLYAGFGAAATIAARRAASRVWRVATGEEPPTKK